MDAELPETLRWAVQSFNVDRVTAEVVGAFAEVSIDSILLKGPTIATWLYAHDLPRLYGDSDLLVQERDWPKAQSVLMGLDFEDGLAPLAHPRMESGAGYPWKRRADGANVDLHYELFGLGAGPEAIWQAFSADTGIELIGGVPVRTPSHPARLLHIALHAVQHGGDKHEKPMFDLARALEVLPAITWGEARCLAERLQGTSTFSAGLSLLPQGRRLANRLGIDTSPSAVAKLRLGDVPLSEGFAELSQADSYREKARLLRREAFPPATFMRWWTPHARRGRLGLGIAYMWRLLWLTYRAIPGYLAWRRALR